MLGFLHKVATGTTHAYAQQLFPRASNDPRSNTRLSTVRHAFQLTDAALNFEQHPLEIYKRSLFGLVKVYNLLPEYWVAKDVKHLQKRLTESVKKACARDAPHWERLFSPRGLPRNKEWSTSTST